MAKKDNDLFDRLRQAGLRKQAAKTLSELGEGASKKVQQAARTAIDELRSLADELERRLSGATQSAAPTRAARPAASARRTSTARSSASKPRAKRAPAKKATPRTTAAKPAATRTAAKPAARRTAAKTTSRATGTTARRTAPKPPAA